MWWELVSICDVRARARARRRILSEVAPPRDGKREQGAVVGWFVERISRIKYAVPHSAALEPAARARPQPAASPPQTRGRGDTRCGLAAGRRG